MNYLKTSKILIIFLYSFTNYSQCNAANQENIKEYVVILHGIARSKSHMQELADYLLRNNYDVININYPSTNYNLSDLSKIIKKKISANIKENKKVNFIGYSMGGLLIRIILNDQIYKNMGRVVQLAPPNKGSEMADLLQSNPLYKKIYGPSGAQLITNQKKIHNLIDKKINYEVGVIAGNISVDPISSYVIPGDDDGKVSVESTKLKNMKDHIIVKASHSFFPSNKEVHRQTLYFLKNGKFNRNTNN